LNDGVPDLLLGGVTLAFQVGSAPINLLETFLVSTRTSLKSRTLQ
jgi:hypothetical protein